MMGGLIAVLIGAAHGPCQIHGLRRLPDFLLHPSGRQGTGQFIGKRKRFYGIQDGLCPFPLPGGQWQQAVGMSFDGGQITAIQ